MAIQITEQQYRQKFGGTPQQQPTSGGYLSGVKERAKTVSNDISQRITNADSGIEKVAAASGAILRGANTLLPEPIQRAEEFAMEKIGQGMTKLTDTIGNNKRLQDYVTKNPDKADQIIGAMKPLASAGEIAGNVLGIEGGIQGAIKGKGLIQESIPKKYPFLDGLHSGATNVVDSVQSLGQGIYDVGTMVKNSVSKIPGRIKTNVAEKQAEMRAIREIPTVSGRSAVSNGINIEDVKSLTSIPATHNESFGKLYQVVKDYASGASQKNPIELVGKPIVDRVKQLEVARVGKGKELGELSKGLGNISRDEVFDPVLNKIKSVPGLEDVTLNDKGKLDFINTTLTTAETASDRVAIQNLFDRAVKSESGQSKHLLRQEIFEVLGGKKKAGIQLTGTQEKAYEAVRQALSDVLESKSAGYKKVSNEYRKIISPLKDLRNVMKTIPEATEDILDMQAGLLARRLTSNAASNPAIKNILRRMDEATAVPGQTRLSVEKLQDYYNILDKYYDISGKTSLQGQVQTAIEKATGPTEAIFNKAREFAGITPAVRQKAIDDILMEQFKSKLKR